MNALRNFAIVAFFTINNLGAVWSVGGLKGVGAGSASWRRAVEVLRQIYITPTPSNSPSGRGRTAIAPPCIQHRRVALGDALVMAAVDAGAGRRYSRIFQKLKLFADDAIRAATIFTFDDFFQYRIGCFFN